MRYLTLWIMGVFAYISSTQANLFVTTNGLTGLETVTVGNPGNEGEWSGKNHGGDGLDRLCGAVDYVYEIGKYEVTAGQYTIFLNAVAATDTYDLYNSDMENHFWGCKIMRHGLPGEHYYTINPDWANRPVNFVSWADAARFCNWLHNNQPIGAQGPDTTENGAYDLNGAVLPEDLGDIERKSDWRWAIPTEDEWYKAAYHKNDGTTNHYWNYPTASDNCPTLEAPPGTDLINGSANHYTAEGTYPLGHPYYRNEAGAYTTKPSQSSYGTFDQAGNVWEWNENVQNDGERGLRGGSFHSFLAECKDLHAAYRPYSYDPTIEVDGWGFRVVASWNDCNSNGIADYKDINSDFSGDCNINIVPDECETDCNSNGIPRDCIICSSPADCNDCDDSTKDGCWIAAGHQVGECLHVKICEPGIMPGDMDGDNDIDLRDYAIFASCFTGPNGETPISCPF